MEVDHQWFRLFCSACGNTFDVPFFCRNRYCKVCGEFRLKRIRQKLVHLVSHLQIPQTHKIRFLTLTIPNQYSVAVGHQILIKGFRRLRQRRWWKLRVRGGCYVIEVTGRPGRWHVHLHGLVESRFLDVFKLSKIWKQCTPGHVVYVKNIPLRSIIRYVTKYLTETKLEACDQLIVSKELQGKRLFQPFGGWISVTLSAPKLGHGCLVCGNECFMPDFYLDSKDYQLKKYGMTWNPSRASPVPDYDTD